MSIKVICAWCNRYLGTKEGETLQIETPLNTTHGICSECASAVRLEIKEFLQSNFSYEATR